MLRTQALAWVERRCGEEWHCENLGWRLGPDDRGCRVPAKALRLQVGGTRWQFPDGSAIVERGGAWEFGVHRTRLRAAAARLDVRSRADGWLPGLLPGGLEGELRWELAMAAGASSDPDLDAGERWDLPAGWDRPGGGPWGP